MEIQDIYDSGRIKTGRTHMRGERLQDGDYILIVMVLIFNSKGEMLIQKRSEHLKWAPGLWTMTAGGAAITGDTSASAAGRELFEELGIQMDFKGRPANFSVNSGSAFLDYFLVTADIDLSSLNMPTSEVAAVRWVSKKEMIAMVKKGECHNYRMAFLEYCFDMSKLI